MHILIYAPFCETKKIILHGIVVMYLTHQMPSLRQGCECLMRIYKYWSVVHYFQSQGQVQHRTPLLLQLLNLRKQDKRSRCSCAISCGITIAMSYVARHTV